MDKIVNGKRECGQVCVGWEMVLKAENTDDNDINLVNIELSLNYTTSSLV